MGLVLIIWVWPKVNGLDLGSGFGPKVNGFDLRNWPNLMGLD